MLDAREYLRRLRAQIDEIADWSRMSAQNSVKCAAGAQAAPAAAAISES